MAGPDGTFLSRATVNTLTIVPVTGYGFIAGSGIVADLQYGIGRDGSIQLDPKFAAFASASGNTLTIRGHSINIDGRALSHDLLPTGMAGPDGTFLSRATVNTLTIVPATGYGFIAGSGIVADLQYGIGRDGSIQLDPKFAAFASASGNTLTIRGHSINIDGRALSHDLLPTGMAGPDGTFLSRATVNTLTIIPATGYGFIAGSGIVADLQYGIGRDGSIQVDPKFASFASASGNTLIIRGHSINIDGRALSHDLLPTNFLNFQPVLSRATVNHFTVMPAAGYGFIVGSGINADFHYGVGLDGSVQLDPKFASFASASGNTLTIRGHTINIDGRALSHDLLPTNFLNFQPILSRATVNHFTVMPAAGYGFIVGSGINADFHYGVGLDGSIQLDPDLASCASASGNTLTIRGHTINIDGRALSHDLLPTNFLNFQPVLSRATVNHFTVMPAAGYGFIVGSGINADFHYGVGLDGSVQLDPKFASFASASGNTLTIRGHTINIDGRALSHDLLPTNFLNFQPVLSRATVNHFTVMPAAGYGFIVGSGINADFHYGVGLDGSIQLDPDLASCASASGDTLTIFGFPIIISAADADSDLVSIVQLGLAAQTPRELVAVLIPAHGYIPRTLNGVFSTPFNVERDGRITFDPAAAGRYLVQPSCVPNPSQPGEPVVVKVYVRATEPMRSAPQGTVAFIVDGRLVGGATLDASGVAQTQISLLPLGDHDIVIEYQGDPDFEPSSTVVRHSVA